MTRGIPAALCKLAMTRIVLATLFIVIFVSVGAFLLFVPPLLIAMAFVASMALLLTGYTLLYCFGIQPALQAVPPVGIDRKH
jgi:hypothetical protein